MVPDSAIISQNEFEEAMKGITVQQKWAKDQKFDKTSALLKVEAFIKNLLQAIGVFSLIDSVTVNAVDWPLVTIPFYSNPVAIPIIIGDGFGANSRNTERTRCEESATRLDLLDSVTTLGRGHLPASPWNAREISPEKSHYERIIKATLD